MLDPNSFQFDAIHGRLSSFAPGGVVFGSGVTAGSQPIGVTLHPNEGAWSTLSDAKRKTGWEAADPERFLRGIAGMNIRSWRYASQTAGARHVGPTAQDFRAAFGLGSDDTTISTVDADGVSMLAIQALLRRTEALEKRIAELESVLRAKQ